MVMVAAVLAPIMIVTIPTLILMVKVALERKVLYILEYLKVKTVN